MQRLREEDWKQLSRTARIASQFSFCPFSNFRVGAAVLSEDGRVFGGCNVENASYGLTICAERNAAFQAVGAGVRSIIAVAIFTPTRQVAAPCGSCRQVLAQFGLNAIVRSTCDSEHFLEWTVRELLPDPFIFEIPEPWNLSNPIPDTGPLRLCIDIDNVITQTDSVIRKAIYDHTEGRVSLLYEDILEFDYRNCCDKAGNSITTEQWNKVHEELFALPEYQELIQPIEGAPDSILKLSESYEIHFATARPARMRAPTLAWLHRYGLEKFDLHFLRQGEKHVTLGGFFASVEDNLDQAIAFSRQGVTRNILLAHPWNEAVRPEHNVLRVNTWSEVVNLLNETSV